jgi:hypothetical protein
MSLDSVAEAPGHVIGAVGEVVGDAAQAVVAVVGVGRVRAVAAADRCRRGRPGTTMRVSGPLPDGSRTGTHGETVSPHFTPASAALGQSSSSREFVRASNIVNPTDATANVNKRAADKAKLRLFQ